MNNYLQKECRILGIYLRRSSLKINISKEGGEHYVNKIISLFTNVIGIMCALKNQED